MNLNIGLIKFNKLPNPVSKRDSFVSFKGRNVLKEDTFEKNINVEPVDDIASEKDKEVPVATGLIWDRRKNKPVNVTVLKSNGTQYETTYRFMSENLKKEYGYLNLTLCKKPKDFEYMYIDDDKCLLKDYPEFSIKGARVVVDYLENHNDSRYSGIGKLADKMTVKHCLDNKIKPVVISIADWDSHVAHYKRGKRFLPLVPDTRAYKFFMDKYGSADVNEILKKLVEKSELTGETVDISGWHPIPMYLPQALAQKYEKELKSEMKK